MKSPAQLSLLALLSLPPLPAVLARTDLSGCTSFTSTVTVNPSAVGGYGNVYPSVVWYDPGSLEICRAPDCGGGRAPPKTDVPGCPLYSGTGLPVPSFLSADPLAAAPPATATATATTGDVNTGTTSIVIAEATGAVAAQSTSGATAEEAAAAAAHTLESSSHAVTVVTLSGMTAPGPVATADATVVSGVAQATGAGLTLAGGNATGPSGSAVVTASGDILGVAMGGLSIALAVAAAFIM